MSWYFLSMFFFVFVCSFAPFFYSKVKKLMTSFWLFIIELFFTLLCSSVMNVNIAHWSELLIWTWFYVLFSYDFYLLRKMESNISILMNRFLFMLFFLFIILGKHFFCCCFCLNLFFVDCCCDYCVLCVGSWLTTNLIIVN